MQLGKILTQFFETRVQIARGPTSRSRNVFQSFEKYAPDLQIHTDIEKLNANKTAGLYISLSDKTTKTFSPNFRSHFLIKNTQKPHWVDTSFTRTPYVYKITVNESCPRNLKIFLIISTIAWPNRKSHLFQLFLCEFYDSALFQMSVHKHKQVVGCPGIHKREPDQF